MKRCPHGYTSLRCIKCRNMRIIRKANPAAVKKKIKKDLDLIFSLNVRLRGCSDNLAGVCISCRRVLPFSKLQNGHYISRSVSQATYFSHDNCRPQCVACNKFKEGNKAEYRRFLIQDIGLDRVEKIELISRSSLFKGLSAHEMAVRLRAEIAELKNHIIRTGFSVRKDIKHIIKKYENNY